MIESHGWGARKKGFRAERPAVDGAGYPEGPAGRRAFLGQLGLLGGGALAALVLPSCGCSTAGIGPMPEPEYLYLDPHRAYLREGGQERFTALFGYSDVTEQAAWSTDDPGIATIDKHGEVTAHTPGPTTVTADYDGYQATASLSVCEHLAGIVIRPAQPVVQVGGSITLEVHTIKFGGRSRDVSAEVRWTVHNPAYARVSNAAGSMGRVDGLAVGRTTVQATLSPAWGGCNSFSDRVKLTVTGS